jgi:hypothetical protein
VTNESVEKVRVLENHFFCWIRNRKLISVTERFYDPRRDTEALDKNGDDINPLLRLPFDFPWILLLGSLSILLNT